MASSNDLSLFELAKSAMRPDRHSGAMFSRQRLSEQMLRRRIDAALEARGIYWYCPTCKLPLQKATCIGPDLTVRA